MQSARFLRSRFECRAHFAQHQRFSSSTLSGSRTLQVPRFDPSLGTLEEITLSINAEVSGTIQGIATGPVNAPNGWATWFTGNLDLSGPGFSVNRDASYPDRSGLVFQPATSVFQFYEPSLRPIGVSLFSNFASYTGSGNQLITISWPTNSQGIFFSNGGSLVQAGRDLGVQPSSVTYRFTPVPEPTSLAYASFAMATGLVRMRRRCQLSCRLEV